MYLPKLPAYSKQITQFQFIKAIETATINILGAISQK